MKEDGSAFASMNPDALSTQLKELFNKINDIEKGLEATLKGDNKIKAFVLSVPQKDATNAEIKYWVTSGSLANGFNERTLIQQFNIENMTLQASCCALVCKEEQRMIANRNLLIV